MLARIFSIPSSTVSNAMKRYGKKCHFPVAILNASNEYFISKTFHYLCGCYTYVRFFFLLNGVLISSVTESCTLVQWNRSGVQRTDSVSQINSSSHIFIQFRLLNADVSTACLFHSESVWGKLLSHTHPRFVRWDDFETKSIIMIIASVAILVVWISTAPFFLTEIYKTQNAKLFYPMRNNLTRYLFIWMWWNRRWRKMKTHSWKMRTKASAEAAKAFHTNSHLQDFRMRTPIPLK